MYVILLYIIMKGCVQMPALQKRSDLINLEQYENLPEDSQIEVFDGIIYNMASPSEDHQTISMELSTSINNYIRSQKGSCKIFHAPFDVILSNDPLTIVQPDIMVVCDKDKLDGKRCNGAPDFIIEIVSPGNPADDYIRKLYYYQNAGVKEYWIVDPAKDRITVWDLRNDNNDEFSFSDKVKAGIYDDLYIDFSTIQL